MSRKRVETLVAELFPAVCLARQWPTVLPPAAQAAAAGAIPLGQPAQSDVAARLSSIRDAVTAAAV